MTESIRVRPLGENETDRVWAAGLCIDRWGADIVVAHSTVYRVASLPGFVAWQCGERLGLVTYHLKGEDCEIVSLDSLREGVGIGTALIDAVRDFAAEEGCARLWVITTNDNLGALRFYQKRGFCMVAVHANALERSRKLKPGIPLVGMYGIPLRDEIELEIPLE